MNENKYLIMIKQEDRTNDIEFYKITDKEVKIKFKNKFREYPYKRDNVIIKENGEIVDFSDKSLYYKNQLLFNIEKVIKFDELIKIVFKNNNIQVFSCDDITVSDAETNNICENILKYFKEISKYVKDGEKESKEIYSDQTFLEREYNKLNYIPQESVLDFYINKKSLLQKQNIQNNIIFPFGFNESQKKAVENVYKSNISIIEGPPGTGKTQTILNIIANLAIMQNKTVAVVSNNNEAVKNVKDKLSKKGYNFIIADLGRNEKISKFFNNLPQSDVKKFDTKENFTELLNKINILNEKLDNLLSKNNRKAQLESMINEYKLEQEYFNKYYEEQNLEEIEKLSFYHKNDSKILDFLLEIKIMNDSEKNHNLYWKIRMLLKYGIKDLKHLKQNIINYILELQKDYYKIKISKLEDEHKSITDELNQLNFKELQKKHQQISEQIFKKSLYDKYNEKTNNFDKSSYKNNINEFINSFPIVLSTTYSLRNCVPNDFLFDYVIIDESSQVDLLAGCLSLSIAKNAIIVGDTKQLPQIVDLKIKDKILNSTVDLCHDYFKNSILSALLVTYGNEIPKQVLREHYRCHPKIIDFCNKRYYKNELISFATEKHLKIKKPLVLHYTPEGNHMRKITRGDNKGTYNQREIDSIKREVLKDSRVNNYLDDQIGIVTPYRLQANKMSQNLDREIESDTIHKYQGREKGLIIFSTVLDSSFQGKKGIKFVDDPCMLNVAVSRAINQFVIVTDKKLFNVEGQEINALIKYIKYNTLDSEIIESDLVSVFDLLYNDYSKKLENLNKRLLNRSKYKSENIIDTIFNSEFQKDEYKNYEYRRGILLKNCLKSLDNLTLREKEFVNNGSSIDFVVFDIMDKKPILFVEVDGFEHHENNPIQLERDKLKDNISRKKNIPIIRLLTNGTYSETDVEDIVKTLKQNIFI